MEQQHQPQQEIIEVQAEQKSSTWQTLKNKVANMSKKSIILVSAAALTLVVGGFVVAEVYENQFEALEHQIERQVGVLDDDNSDDQQVQLTQSTAATTATSTATTTPANQLATAYGVNLVDSSELDGTYTATIFNETYTLTVKGNQATLQESEADGEQDIEQVIFDLEKKIAYVDGEAETYTFDGKTLVLTEVDNDLFDKDTISFTKQ